MTIGILPACMGGWCVSRERCARYVEQAEPGVPVAERLCPRGMRELPWPIYRPAAADERARQRSLLVAA